MINLNLTEIKSSLELKVIRSLISTIYKFIGHFNDMSKLVEQENSQSGQPVVKQGLMELQSTEVRHACVLKLIKFIDAICSHSIEQEKTRGESYEAIQKKIEQAKAKKQREKMRVLINKKSQDNSPDEDEQDSEEKKLL